MSRWWMWWQPSSEWIRSSYGDEMYSVRVTSRYTTASGLVYETVSPAETLEQAAELIGYVDFRQQQEDARKEGRYLGIGLSLYIEPQFGFGILGTEGATIRVEPSGELTSI